MKLNRILKKSIFTLLAFILFLSCLYLVLNVEDQDLTDTAREIAPGNFLELSMGKVHYLLEGPQDAPLVVLVHGFSVPSYVWEPTYSALLKAGYQVLSFDLFGRGYSDRPDVEYDIDLFQTQLREMISKLEIDGPVHLVGLSMGGPIVARYAGSYPDEVISVTLISPVVVQITSQDIFPLNMPGIGEYLMITVMEPIVLPRLQSADFVHPENFPGWEEEYRVQLQYHGTGRAFLSTIRNQTKQVPEAEYEELKATGLPVLLIWGKEDQTITKDQIQTLQGILPAMDIQVIDEAGHVSHYEKPDQVNPVLIKFLDGLD